MGPIMRQGVSSPGKPLMQRAIALVTVCMTERDGIPRPDRRHRAAPAVAG
jgi:hypothetical protein